LQAFPQQALWSLAAVCKSTMPARQQAAGAIISAAKRAADAAGRRLFEDFARLVDQLVRLCHWQPNARGLQRHVSAHKEFAKLVGGGTWRGGAGRWKLRLAH
jgi:serine/threonine-protein kinase ATR